MQKTDENNFESTINYVIDLKYFKIGGKQCILQK